VGDTYTILFCGDDTDGRYCLTVRVGQLSRRGREQQRRQRAAERKCVLPLEAVKGLSAFSPIAQNHEAAGCACWLELADGYSSWGLEAYHPNSLK
jgi:hypothetical protein